MKDLALVGAGHWGKNLARNFHRLGVLSTVCDTNESHLRTLKKNYPDIHTTHSYEELLLDPKISKIAIAVPTSLHYSFAKRALHAGKDVFVEKSMCTSSHEAASLIKLAENGFKILMVGHILHYHPAIFILKKILSEGMIGTPYHYIFNRLNFGSIGEEKSALWAFAPHDISILLALNKGLVLESVQATHNSYFQETVFDQSHIHVQFFEGVGADIHVSWMNPFRERKITVIGSEGMVVFDDLKDWDEKVTYWKSSVSYKDERLVFKQEDSIKIPVEAPDGIFGNHHFDKEPLFIECLHFLNSCTTREPPFTDGREGLQVIQVIEAAEKSAFNGGKLVNMQQKVSV